MDKTTDFDTHLEVQRYYGETLSSSDDLRTTACCTAAAPADHIRLAIDAVHDEVRDRYYGCGLVLPEALDGLRALDLGCGAGRDVYILSRLVGSAGNVVGVDMTVEQLAVANQYRDWHAEQFGYTESNVEFLHGNIEALDELSLADSSFDVIVSNCVINLAVDKEAVLRSAYRLLKPGGELYFSDVYADRRIAEELMQDPVLYGECLSGALYWNDFLELARHCGFSDARMVEHEPIDITDPALSERIGEIKFRSVTCRLFKAQGLESGQENYGQTAEYLGTLAEHPSELVLDEHHQFVCGEPMAVSGNTATIIVESRFSEFFDVKGDKSSHLGGVSDKCLTNPFASSGVEIATGKCC
jgi:arsenite methyltransferase